MEKLIIHFLGLFSRHQYIINRYVANYVPIDNALIANKNLSKY